MLDATCNTPTTGPAPSEAPHDRLITVRNVSVRAGDAAPLADVDLSISAGPPTVLIGPNGAGKTTLLRVLMGLTRPSTGTIERSSPPPRLAFVFQKPVMLRRSAAANVAFALRAAGRPAEPDTVDRLLDRVGLRALGGRPARKLSGGEQQRLAFARALARAPDVLLLDEPTASLDPAQSRAIEEIVTGIAGAGVKIVMATHDLGQARRLAGEMVLLVGGRIVETAPARSFFEIPSTEQARRFLAGELVT